MTDSIDARDRKNLFKDAMAQFPSGVVIAIARNMHGELRGFTASAFCSVSMEPPMVLLCLAKSAESWSTFTGAEHFTISILPAGYEDLALKFARRGENKFADANQFADSVHDLKTVEGAVAALICRRANVVDGGDHTVLLAEIEEIETMQERTAMLHYRRQFLDVSHLVAASQAGA